MNRFNYNECTELLSEDDGGDLCLYEDAKILIDVLKELNDSNYIEPEELLMIEQALYKVGEL